MPDDFNAPRRRTSHRRTVTQEDLDEIVDNLRSEFPDLSLDAEYAFAEGEDECVAFIVGDAFRFLVQLGMVLGSDIIDVAASRAFGMSTVLVDASLLDELHTVAFPSVGRR